MSGGDGKQRPRRPRHLSDEDIALWELVASRIDPARGKPRVNDVEPAPEPPSPERLKPHRRPPLDASPPVASPARPPPAARTPPAPKAPPPPPPPQPVALERRKARRIARGTEEIDARLDLHGMTQSDAHAALVHFVRRCHADGLRNLLVITGKGGAPRGEDATDHWHDVSHAGRSRGVLRRNVPRWLAGADIGTLVVSYTTAHLRHGGDGALYVRLRRQR